MFDVFHNVAKGTPVEVQVSCPKSFQVALNPNFIGVHEVEGA